MKPIAPAVDKRSLGATQRWFASAIMGETSRAAALTVGDLARSEIDHVVTAEPHLSAIERLGVYQEGYTARLIECLVDDYPAVHYTLGEASFAALATAYVERYPPSSPSLNEYGKRMAQFCRKYGATLPLPNHGSRGFWQFASELASLEWALVEVVHAPASRGLSAADLQAVAADAWPMLRLVPSPALRVLSFTFPVHVYFQEFVADHQPVVPEPQWGAVAVYRQHTTLWRRGLTAPMAMLLQALVAGKPLGAGLETLAAKFEPSEISAGLSDWLRDWVAEGFFDAIARLRRRLQMLAKAAHHPQVHDRLR